MRFLFDFHGQLLINTIFQIIDAAKSYLQFKYKIDKIDHNY